jgi:hypothetical protein
MRAARLAGGRDETRTEHAQNGSACHATVLRTKLADIAVTPQTGWGHVRSELSLPVLPTEEQNNGSDKNNFYMNPNIASSVRNNLVSRRGY